MGLDRDEAALLRAQNQERARLGLPLMRWNPTLAVHARQWAERLVKIGALAHASEDENPDEGENLWMGTHGAYTPAQMVGGWLAERSLFRFGPMPDVSTTGRFEDVGHYTQIVWRATMQVGCAIVPDKAWDYLVCRYSPAGNYDGEVPY